MPLEMKSRMPSRSPVMRLMISPPVLIVKAGISQMVIEPAAQVVCHALGSALQHHGAGEAGAGADQGQGKDDPHSGIRSSSCRPTMTLLTTDLVR